MESRQTLSLLKGRRRQGGSRTGALFILCRAYTVFLCDSTPAERAVRCSTQRISRTLRTLTYQHPRYDTPRFARTRRATPLHHPRPLAAHPHANSKIPVLSSPKRLVNGSPASDAASSGGSNSTAFLPSSPAARRSGFCRAQGHLKPTPRKRKHHTNICTRRA